MSTDTGESPLVEGWWTVEAVLSLEERIVAVECAAPGQSEEEASRWASEYWLRAYRDCEYVAVTDCYPLCEDTGEEEGL